MGLLTILRPSTHKPIPLPLASILEELDIAPFSPEAVAAHKKKQMDATFERLKPTDAKWLCPEVNLADPAGVMAGLIDGYEREVVNYLRSTGRDWTVRFSHIMGQRPIFIALCWCRMALASVGAPAFVQRKVEQIREKLPGATFEADELHSHSGVYDPFLVVKFGSEEYYIEVWGQDDSFHS